MIGARRLPQQPADRLDAISAASGQHNLTASDDDIGDLLPSGVRVNVLRPLDPDRTRELLRSATLDGQAPTAWSALLASTRTLVRRCSSRASCERIGLLTAQDTHAASRAIR